MFAPLCMENEFLLFYYLWCHTEVSQGYVKILKMTNSMDKLQYSIMNPGPFFCTHMIQ